MSDWKSLLKKPEEWERLNYDDPRLDAFSQEVERRYKLPPYMVQALKNAGERTPSKESGRPTVSPKGAKGVMQFMDATRKLADGKYDHDVNNPFESINAAGMYMRDLVQENMQRFKNEFKREPENEDMRRIYKAAIANYNGGPKAALAVLKNEKDKLPDETKGYLQRIGTYLDEKFK